MDTLYVVRHGQTEWNAEDRFQGRLDSPLTAAGRYHAEVHGELLARESVPHLIASPLGRTRTTAELINRRLGATLEFDDRLVERDCGAWSGLTSDQISREFPEEWSRRQHAPYFHRPPGGENLADMLIRVRPLLDSLHERPHTRVALISHGMMARVILSYLMKVPPEGTSAIRQPNDVVYRLSFDRPSLRCEHFRSGVGPSSGFSGVVQVAE